MDLISRQDAIEAIVNTPSQVQDPNIPLTSQYDGATFRQIEILGILQSLPSAEPKKGKWEVMTDGNGLHPSYFCSVCGTQEGKPHNFCPDCGARMENE